ncbi:hypothetical protein PtoMrB4_29330 [Metapseudomonas otitidis]|uniref:Uncharacterized protein n=1 Tax=Metapseudomonas otitidis TaxID=319939 RepID=A0A679GDI7_9GAMM|nr:hypothetical protein PtoMrB4_29330 [Pseudomonas otitidis]
MVLVPGQRRIAVIGPLLQLPDLGFEGFQPALRLHQGGLGLVALLAEELGEAAAGVVVPRLALALFSLALAPGTLAFGVALGLAVAGAPALARRRGGWAHGDVRVALKADSGG